MKRILFVCIENAGRSQMAMAFANHYGGTGVVAESAGTVPAEHVNPTVVAVMKEKGLDTSHCRPIKLDVEMAKRADMIITMGCSIAEICPAPVLKNSVDWKLEDPKGKPIETVREIRDEIERRVRRLVSEPSVHT